MASTTFVYDYFDQDELYINLTNQCTNHCDFCIRYTPTGVENEDLWLEYEPTVEEVEIALIMKEFYQRKEIVFCGYGEPTIRYEEMIEICKFIRAENPGAKIRLNTNGHGNEWACENICPRLEGLIDQVSISMNASDGKKYDEMCHCIYGEDGYSYMLEFAEEAKKYIPSVVLSVVDVIPPEEIEICRKRAEEIGVDFRVRHYIE